MRRGRKDLSQLPVLPVIVICFITCCALCAYWFAVVVTVPPSPSGPVGGGPLISSMYAPKATSSVEEALVKGDGQVFAGQATDPAVRRTDMVAGPPEEQAYRYQRPLYGWVGWIASGGQRHNVAWALVAVTVLSTVALVGVAAMWLAVNGREPALALALLLTPGVFVDLTWVGPEVLGTALALIGTLRWLRRTSSEGSKSMVITIAFFAAASLCRETLLLLPAILALVEVWRRNLLRSALLAITAVPYVSWVLFLRVRIGAWPRGAIDDRISFIPFRGLIGAASGWGALDFMFAGATIGLAMLAAWRHRHDAFGAMVAGHVLFASVLGAPVWDNFSAYGRVLLPMTTLTLLALAVRAPATARLPQPRTGCDATLGKPEGHSVTIGERPHGRLGAADGRTWALLRRW